MAVSPDGRSAYVASSLSDAVAVFDREPSQPVLAAPLRDHPMWAMSRRPRG